MTPRLPLLYRLLASVLAPQSVRASVLDDLEEEFAAISTESGDRAARRWIRRQFASSDWLRLRRSTPHQRRSSPHDNSSALAGGPAPRRLGESLMGNVAHDLLTTLKQLRRRPRFAALVILTVAIGIVGGATVLGAIDAVLLQPLPYTDEHELVTIQGSNEEVGITDGPVSWVNVGEWSELTDTFEAVFAVQGTGKVLTGVGEPAGVTVALVSPSVFAALGVEPAVGRGFAADEATPGNDRVVVLSQGLWARRFERDPDVVGKRILLDGDPYEVVGVLPSGVQLPNDLAFSHERDMWAPLAPSAEDMPRGRRAVSGHARLADGVSVGAAQEALDALFASQTELDPETNAGWTPRVRRVVDTIVGPFRGVLQLMLGAAAMLALLACVNLINLMLANGMARARELSVRSALGAVRRRLVTQLVAEGVVLGTLGGLLGLAVTAWLLAVFIRLTPGDVPRLEQAAMSPLVAAAVLVAAVGIGVVFGAVPAVLLTRSSRLRRAPGATGASTERGPRRVLGSLVVTQVALAVVLLIGAGLLGRSFVSLLGTDTGFETDDILVAQLVLVPPNYPSHRERTAFVRDALERFRAIPGVEAVGVTNFLPYSGTNTTDGFDVRDYEPVARQQAGFRAADPGYFEVMGVQTVRGRALESRDMGATPGAVISESLATKFFPDTDPIGRFIERSEGWIQIVGVVADVRHEGPNAEVAPEWYAPFAYDPYSLKAFVLRSTVPADDVAPALRGALAELDPNLAPLAVQTMNDYLDEHLASPRFNAATLGAFALVAILIAAQGVAGMMAHSVARRGREIGIRKALGAQARTVRNQVVREGVSLAVLGVGIGLAAALPLTGLLQSLLLDISPTDPVTLSLVSGFVLLTAALACYLPARRAGRVDPLVAMRDE